MLKIGIVAILLTQPDLPTVLNNYYEIPVFFREAMTLNALCWQ